MDTQVGIGLHERYQLEHACKGITPGTLYEGVDLKQNTRILVRHYSSHQYSRAKLRQLREEARTLARLASTDPSGIVRVLDVSQNGKGLFLVLEYPTAGSLAALLERPENRAGLPISSARALTQALARALASTQEAGIIHGCITSSNVLLFRNREQHLVAKLSDFDLAHLRELEPAVECRAPKAPEQKDGSVAAPASDIWALGALLYEVITGHVLPTSEGHPLVAPLVYQPGLPEWFNRLILQMLEPDPLQRPSAGDVLQKLQAHRLPITGTSIVGPTVESTVMAPPSVLEQRRRRHRTVTALFMGTVLTIVLLLLLQGAIGRGMEGLRRSLLPPLAGTTAMVQSPDTPVALRPLPTIGEPALARLPDSTQVTLLAHDGKGKWYQVRVTVDGTEQEGWVYGAYLPISALGYLPPYEGDITQRPPPTQGFAARARVVAPDIPGGLNVRSEPVLSSTVLGQVPDGANVWILHYSEDGEWAYIETDHVVGSGWASITYLSILTGE